MRRLVLPVAVALALTTLPLPAFATGFDPNDIPYPVDGENQLTNSFGDPRSEGRSHEGVDIMAAKGVPVLAAADGVVRWIGSSCCYLEIDHGGGWATRYLHLNNDTQAADGSYSDDGAGWGIAPEVVVGATVTRGQVIGWVGDSGNAEDAGSHLQFEIRKDGVPLDPYPYLVGISATWSGVFRDDDYSVHQANIDKIYAAGITYGCDSDRFCPEREITRGEMAAFIARALRLEATTGVPAYDDVVGNIFETEVDKIQTAAIAFGCDADSFCPDRPLYRHEMAELLVRAFGYQNPTGTDYFTDDEANIHEESINRLAASGITVGCNTGTEFCPESLLTRAEMASFFARALGL